MKTVTVKILKKELSHQSHKELMGLCLHLSKFKKENKELLTYLLFESADEESYIISIKKQLDNLFENVNKKNYFFIRKSMRKILTLTKKYIRYSQKKETEVELLLYYCKKLKEFIPSIKKSVRLQNVFDRQILLIKKNITTLHEDLQYDYQLELKEILRNTHTF